MSARFRPIAVAFAAVLAGTAVWVAPAPVLAATFKTGDVPGVTKAYGARAARGGHRC